MLKHPIEREILDILNSWSMNLSKSESNDINFDVSKHKYRNLYLKKTGEFLKIPQRLETQLFSKIVLGLSKQNEIDDKIIDEYLDWCFENYEIIIKKYKNFNLQNIANFSEHWNPNLFKQSTKKKCDLESLNDLKISDNVFLNCEKYGIPLVATKLSIEKNLEPKIIRKIIPEKLSSLTQDTLGLTKLRNMLRMTVENEPYFSEIIFSNYQKELKVFFDKFKGEPWCKDVI
jgi:hypothetical protein